MGVLEGLEGARATTVPTDLEMGVLEGLEGGLLLYPLTLRRVYWRG